MMQDFHNFLFLMTWSVSAAAIVLSILRFERSRRLRRKRLAAITSDERSILKTRKATGLSSWIDLWILERNRPVSASRQESHPYWKPYAGTALSAGLGGLCLAIVISQFPGPEFLGSWQGITFLILGTVFCGYAPRFYRQYRINRHRQHIQDGMPDLIDLLVLCVDAGLTLEAALARAVGQIQQINPVLSREMQQTLDEISILPDRSQAFLNLQKRADSDLVNFFVLAVNQTSQYGTPLSATLKALAEDNRRAVRIDLEKRASRLPVLLSLPLILFILPPAICLSVGPGFVLMMQGLAG